MVNRISQESTDKMKKTISQLSQDLSTLRAGRANPALLDKVQVEYYGTVTPLNQLASINAPEARLLTVQAWDKSALADIEKAILKAELGLTPTNDGEIIRINIPPLTEERRQELVKMTRKMGEEAKVAIRNVRRDANDSIKKQQKDGEISEDESRRHQETIQQITDEHIQEVDGILENKEKEIMEV